MAIITVAIWGTTFVSTKILLNHGLTAVEILFYRFVLAYICIWFFSFRNFFAKTLRDELLFVAAGLSGGSLYFLAENTALSITLASNVSLIICTAPILTALLFFLLNKNERLKPNLIYGSLIALVGVALVVFNGGFILKISPVGDFLTLFAALMWAFYGLIVRRLNMKYPTLFITRKVFFYGIVTIIPTFYFTPLKFDAKVFFHPEVLMNLVFLGLIASMLCYIMWNAAVKQLGIMRVTNYIYLVPLVTLITSSMVLGEIITIIALLGSVFILGGVYVAERGIRVKRIFGKSLWF